MKKRLKDSTIEQLFNIAPTLPPRQLLLDLINECVFILSGLSLGKLNIDAMEDDIKEVCSRAYNIDKEMEKPECQELLHKEEQELITHFINNVDTDGFKDMMINYGKHLKEDEGASDEVVDKVISKLSSNRIEGLDSDNKGEA